MGLFEKYRNIVESNLDILRRADLQPAERREAILKLEKQRRYLHSQERRLAQELTALGERLGSGDGDLAELRKRHDATRRRLEAARAALADLEAKERSLLKPPGGGDDAA